MIDPAQTIRSGKPKASDCLETLNRNEAAREGEGAPEAVAVEDMSGSAQKPPVNVDRGSLGTVAPPLIAPRAVESIIQEIAQLSTMSAGPNLEEQLSKMPNDSFDADIVVIGSGPGGYVAAIRAAQLGAKTICIEKEWLGGTCLNWGCIPSKALIGSVERLNHVKHAGKLGISTGDVSIDFGAVMARKDKIVQTQRGGVGMLFKKNGVRHVQGFAKFLDPHTIEVTNDGKVVETIKAKYVILAMGSSVIRLPIPGLEGGADNGVWSSDDAVYAKEVPKRMLVLGGGAVGTELSYVYNGLGSEITLVEMLPSLLPMMDSDLGAELGKALTRQGIKVKTGAGLEKCEKTKTGWKCTIKKGTEIEEVEVDVVLLGVGRKANTDNMNLEQIGVQLHRRGVQVVDDTLITHVPNIWAIGDVTGRIQLAHVASAEGVNTAQNIILGTKKAMDYKVVPNCVYAIPEVASVGLTQSEAEAKGFDVVTGRYQFRPNGKAMAIDETDGFVKVVSERKYGEVLGVHIIGPHATDLIEEAATALKLEATVESMIETIHPHPTLTEVVMEAFEDAAGHSIHKL
jgi:dihydrolipoamide dehydrogenase